MFGPPVRKVLSLRGEGAQLPAGGTSVPKMVGPRTPNRLRPASVSSASYSPNTVMGFAT